MTNEVDYCPDLNVCTKRREDCYQAKYRECKPYQERHKETVPRKCKGLAWLVQNKLGNPDDKNWSQL